MPAAIATAYANYKRYAVRYDLSDNSFACYYASRGKIVDDARITDVLLHGKKVFCLRDYHKVHDQWFEDMNSTRLSIYYEDGPDEQPTLTINFLLDLKGIHLRMDCRGDLDFHFSGRLLWGEDMEHDTFAVCLNRDGQDLRSAYGPATSTVDNALFDRKNDAALEINGCPTVRLNFKWEDKAYHFSLNTEGNDYGRGFSLRVHTQVYERRFGVPFKPINKHNIFPAPPAGWMTWYAVQFDASEKTVLENARWQAEHLLDYGANVVWVDWEWFHGSFSGKGERDVDTFHPDPRRYPNGLKHVADEIKKLGMIPALWVGFTNDPTENDFIRKNPDAVLIQKPSWCGQYFLDVSNPKYLSEYITTAFSQLSNWGYKALKWDCLPLTLQYLDRYHDSMANPELTSEEAFRSALLAARNVVGSDFYMLSCSGQSNRDITMGADIFDGARIGGDIFQWDEFISQCVARVMKYYAYHNVIFYNDPDNVVLRPKFNTFDQALSRLSFNALLGLPLTIGDPLPELPEDRVELLKRGLPPLDTHPMDIREAVHDCQVVKLNLAIERPYENWNVVDLLNLRDVSSDVLLDLKSDLHLSDGIYLVYDYWEKRYLGEFKSTISLQLPPYASKILAVRKKLNRPQLLSTSRHVSQGAVDINSLVWHADTSTLSAVSHVVKGDPYVVTLYVPETLRPFTEGNRTSTSKFIHVGGNIWQFTIQPNVTGDVAWSVDFSVRHPV